MKYFLVLMTAFIILGTQHVFSQEKSSRTIITYSVNFYAQTTFGVSCEQFEKAFNVLIDTVVISAVDSIHQLDQLLEKVKFKHSKTVVDTRASIVFTDLSGKKLTFCLDFWNIALNDKTISPFPELSIFLRSLLPKKNHPSGLKS